MTIFYPNQVNIFLTGSNNTNAIRTLKTRKSNYEAPKYLKIKIKIYTNPTYFQKIKASIGDSTSSCRDGMQEFLSNKATMSFTRLFPSLVKLMGHNQSDGLPIIKGNIVLQCLMKNDYKIN